MLKNINESDLVLPDIFSFFWPYTKLLIFLENGHKTEIHCIRILIDPCFSFYCITAASFSKFIRKLIIFNWSVFFLEIPVIKPVKDVKEQKKGMYNLLIYNIIVKKDNCIKIILYLQTEQPTTEILGSFKELNVWAPNPAH